MDLTFLFDWLGERGTGAAGGAVIGIVFGAFAQQSRFCLRAAAVEFSRGAIGQKVAVWLLVFSAAIFGTQLLMVADVASLGDARQLASPQSLSGAAIGGLMFGCGMVLARGCASRLLVLSATGNLRALLAGLVFAVVAQASLHGFLSPARDAIAGAVTTTHMGGNDLLSFAGLSQTAALTLTILWLAGSLILAARSKLPAWNGIAALLTGTAIPAAWWFTNQMATQAFDPVQIEGVSFTGPSADTLMLFLAPAASPLDFDIGLVPGVFLGAFLAALATGQLQLQGFVGGASMRRYLIGASLMGFGGMLAGGCAVGAGVTGASIFALSAWVTLSAIWLAAALTDYALDRYAETEKPFSLPDASCDQRPAADATASSNTLSSAPSG